MRTKLDIDDDVLVQARALARQQNRSVGDVISELARKGLIETTETLNADHDEFFGFQPLPLGGQTVTDEMIDELRRRSGG